MSEAREPKWRRYLRFARPNPAADLDDELRDHIESTVEALIARGMTRDDARAEALRRFGDVGRVRSEVRRLDDRHLVSTRRATSIESFVYDLRHAARGLRRSPGFALVAVLSIALGIAANATVFSVVNALLLRPIPGTHGDRLVRLYANHHSPLDWHDLAWFRDHSASFDGIVGERYGAIGFRASPASETERVHMSYVTQGFFPSLGVTIAAGRAFDEADAAPSDPVVVLSYPFWQRRFAGDPAVVGKTIFISEHPLTVVGVTAPQFRSSVMSWVPDVFIPFSIAPILTGRRLDEFGGSFYTTARLRGGVSEDAAASELRTLMSQLAHTDSARYDRMTMRLDHVRGVNAEARDAVTAGSVFLMAMVGMVLLIACANVANLLLGRAATRRTEIGVRLAIGASRGRLVRQMLVESFLLAAIGSALGFAAAWFLTRIITVAVPAEAGIDETYFAPDGHVLLFTLLLCVVTTILFGALPAIRSASSNLVTLLRGGDGQRRRRRGSLIGVQAAMCVLLLAVASLFLRSLSSMRHVDPGFQSEGVVDVDIDLGLAGHGHDPTATFATILTSAAAIPGVEQASLTAVVPLSGSNMETRVLPAGQTVANRHDAPTTYFHVVAPHFFETLRIPLRRGREFAPTDRDGSPRVAIVSETAARKLWPDGDAVGKRLHWGGSDGPLLEVVGIAGNADYVMPGETPKSVVYVPFAQDSRDEMTLQLRTRAKVATIRGAIWDMVHATVPALPPPPVTRMADDMSITLLPVRLGVELLGAFALIALLLAAAGIYGVAAHSVAQRTREIGIRAALGATRARLVRMVLWESGRRVAIGALVGLALTIGIAVGLQRVLYGIEPLDPVVLGSVAVVITAVAILSALVPASRAANADPMSAIRSE
jgi:putative ABC transport system permease protein